MNLVLDDTIRRASIIGEIITITKIKGSISIKSIETLGILGNFTVLGTDLMRDGVGGMVGRSLRLLKQTYRHI